MVGLAVSDSVLATCPKRSSAYCGRDRLGSLTSVCPGSSTAWVCRSCGALATRFSVVSEPAFHRLFRGSRWRSRRLLLDGVLLPSWLTGWAVQRVVSSLPAVAPRRVALALRRCPGVFAAASARWRCVLIPTLIASSCAVSGFLPASRLRTSARATCPWCVRCSRSWSRSPSPSGALAALDPSVRTAWLRRPLDVPSALLWRRVGRLAARWFLRLAGASPMLSWCRTWRPERSLRALVHLRSASPIAFDLSSLALLWRPSSDPPIVSSALAGVTLCRGILGPGGVPRLWLSAAVDCRVSAARPGPFRSPVEASFSVRSGAPAIVVSAGLAALRCRVGLLYGVQSRWALLYAVRIVTFAVRAGSSKASVRALCSTSFRLQSGGLGGRSRSTVNRVRGGGADALSVPYDDGSAWFVTACDRVLFSTRWGCPWRYRFRRRCRFPRRRVAAVRRAVWRPARSRRCAPGCGSGVRFPSLRAPLYERRFRSGSTPSEWSFARAVARTRRGLPEVVVRRGVRLVVVAAACPGACRSHARLTGRRIALAVTSRGVSRSPACPRPSLPVSLRALLDATSDRVLRSTPTRCLWSAGGCLVALGAR